MSQATATAHPNIALVKYWGKRDLPLNLPAVSSLSLTVCGEEGPEGPRWRTRTTVHWGAGADEVLHGGKPASDGFARKVLGLLDRLDPKRPPCRVETENDFPTAAGLASSASGFAALALAAAAAAGRPLDKTALSRLARTGSGSACRSLWGGFVTWPRGRAPDGSDSHGIPLFPADHWDLRMVVAVVTEGPKAVGSTEGMERTRRTSPLWKSWVEQSGTDLNEAVDAVRARDLQRLGEVMERSTFKMHGTMQSSTPPLFYWQPQTLAVLHEVFALRQRGIGAWATLDAGPQVKVLCETAQVPQVTEALAPLAHRTVILRPGPDARVLT